MQHEIAPNDQQTRILQVLEEFPKEARQRTLIVLLAKFAALLDKTEPVEKTDKSRPLKQRLNDILARWISTGELPDAVWRDITFVLTERNYP